MPAHDQCNRTGVFQIKKILPLQAPERRHNSGGAVFIIIGKHHKISHGVLLLEVIEQGVRFLVSPAVKPHREARMDI
jgi:hypothetical protein